MTHHHEEQLYLSKEELRRINEMPPLRELMTYRRCKGRVKVEVMPLAVSAVC